MNPSTKHSCSIKLWTVGIISLMILSLAMGCSSKKNTAFNRFYQGFTTRYNVYFNGINAYDEAYKQQIQGYKETYARTILLDPATATAYEPKAQTGGPFDGAIIKGRKAISLHSIRTKPERKAGWQNDPKQVAWQQRTEYNAFLHNAWMLVGKSQFRNGDFLEAMSTFAYIARLYKSEPHIRDLARLWQVRCYTAMGWLSEGRQIFDLIPAGSSAFDNKYIFHLSQAERLLAEGKHSEAIPFLMTAAKYEPNRIQRARMNYLTGQILLDEGRVDEARRSFARVIRLSPPFELDLAARIKRTEIGSQGQSSQVLRELKSMARKEKYVEVLDQIYLAIGNVHMNVPDTTRAIEAYQFAIDTSKTKAADFALSNIRLGDIYMARRQYTKAQPCFAAAIAAIENRNPDYERVAKLSTDLDALVIHAAAVEEQDSLQHLAAMPEVDRNRIIDSAILAAKEEEKRRKRQEELENRKQQQEVSNQEFGSFDNRSNNVPTPPSGQQSASRDFYFYNPQLITQGKASFERQWGKRTLEDNWRRRRKEISVAPDSNPLTDPAKGDSVTDSVPSGDSTVQAANDPFQRDYYLARLPLTSDALAESNKIVADGLYGMGQVFNDQMEYYDEAARVYKQLLDRYPDYDGKLELLYKLYLLSERLGRKDDAQRYRQRIIQDFPDDALAKALADPLYLDKLRAMDQEQNRLYTEAFDAYLKGDEATVREHYATVQHEYPTSELLPKFAFLNALGYVLVGDADGFRTSLQALVEHYPQGDVSELSQVMLADLLRGRTISRGGYTNLNWDINLATDSLGVGAADLPPFSRDRFGRWHLILVYPEGAADRNAVVFAVSAFNYSRFTRFTLDAIPTRKGKWEQVIIKSLPNETESWYYIRQAYSPDGYMPHLGDKALLLPISEKNAELMERGRTLGDYMLFVSDSIGGPNAAIILDRWDAITGRKTSEQILNPQSAVISPSDTLKQSTDSIRTVRPRPLLPDSVARSSSPITFQIDRDKAISADSISTVTVDTIQPLKPRPQVIAPENITIREVQTIYKDRVKDEKAQAREAERAKKKREKERQAELKEREKQRRQLLREREKERRERLRQREKERREREKQRRAEIKQREEERKAKQKQKEATRRQRAAAPKPDNKLSL